MIIKDVCEDVCVEDVVLTRGGQYLIHFLNKSNMLHRTSLLITRVIIIITCYVCSNYKFSLGGGSDPVSLSRDMGGGHVTLSRHVMLPDTPYVCRSVI